MKAKKTLGQIAYESITEGGKQNFGKWKNAPDFVRRVHEQMAQAVAKEMRHLHPGNAPTRAQIVKDLNYLYECPSPMGTALVAKRFGVGFKGMRFV